MVRRGDESFRGIMPLRVVVTKSVVDGRSLIEKPKRALGPELKFVSMGGYGLGFILVGADGAQLDPRSSAG